MNNTRSLIFRIVLVWLFAFGYDRPLDVGSRLWDYAVLVPLMLAFTAITPLLEIRPVLALVYVSASFLVLTGHLRFVHAALNVHGFGVILRIAGFIVMAGTLLMAACKWPNKKIPPSD